MPLILLLYVRAPTGNLLLHTVWRRLLHLLSKGLQGRTYLHGFCGSFSAAHASKRLGFACDGDRLAALVLPRVQLQAPWRVPAGHSIFLWTPGFPFVSFVLPQAWWNEMLSNVHLEGPELYHEFSGIPW